MLSLPRVEKLDSAARPTHLRHEWRANTYPQFCAFVSSPASIRFLTRNSRDDRFFGEVHFPFFTLNIFMMVGQQANTSIPSVISVIQIHK